MTNNNPLIERLSRIVRDRGDVELFIELDRIADFNTEEEQTAAFGAVVQKISKKRTGASDDAKPSKED